ncbi:MAG TPA: IS21 family transposase [Candidatus Dormibacteraeota bacterium]
MESGELWMELHVLHQHGWSISALARHFHLNRRTVRRELEAERPRRYPQRAPLHPFSVAQLAHIERRLAVCPVIRGTDLHRELRTEYGYAGSYWTFLRQVRPLRPAVVAEPVVRFETLPGMQIQADWKHLGVWPLGEELVELHAMVAILGSSRRPAIRIATSCTREVSFERLVRCLDDLGGATREILTDRDSAFCSHEPAGPLFVPEWLDLCELLGTVPRACRAYRAQTKGKIERENRELEQSFKCWLTGQVMPTRPTLADYDEVAARWIAEVILPRRHRTTGRVIDEAWAEERRLLTPIPEHVLQRFAGEDAAVRAVLHVVDDEQRALGETVEVRDLRDYEVAL